MTAVKKALLMAGGTGGHVMPGLAVAERLIADGITCAWLGRASGMEASLLAQYSDIRYYPIKMQALRGKSWQRKLVMPWIFCSALWQCWRAIRTFKPDIVCGFGGYVSAPGGIAAWLARVPLIVHEQNKVSGLTNRLLSKFAKRVCESFPNTFPSHPKIICTGNPVRAAIRQIEMPSQRWQQRDAEPLHIAILGGSQGAKVLNETVPATLGQFAQQQSIRVHHQTGSAMQQQVAAVYARDGVDAKVDAFITDMAAFYAWADVVIARAGATTVAELAAAGVPSILIPYPYAVDDHQTANANTLVSVGAARLLPETNLTADLLISMLHSITMESTLLDMALAARASSAEDAAQSIANLLMEILHDE